VQTTSCDHDCYTGQTPRLLKFAPDQVGTDARFKLSQHGEGKKAVLVDLSSEQNAFRTGGGMSRLDQA